jgi:hypothetical protein
MNPVFVKSGLFDFISVAIIYRDFSVHSREMMKVVPKSNRDCIILFGVLEDKIAKILKSAYLLVTNTEKWKLAANIIVPDRPLGLGRVGSPA